MKHGTLLWAPDDEPWRYREVAEERAAMAALRAVLDYAGQIVAEYRLERFGDGEGAIPLREFEEAIERHLGHPLHDERDVKKSRPPISARKRVGVFARDGYKCVICGDADPEQLSVDHIVPRSKGGGDELDNLRTLCMPCNLRKGTKDA